jgi:hypothetical protein
VKAEDQLRELEEVAAKKSIKVTYEALHDAGAGGLCKVKGEWRVLIDKRAAAGDRVSVLAAALAKFPLEDVYMSETVRELVAKKQK